MVFDSDPFEPAIFFTAKNRVTRQNVGKQFKHLQDDPKSKVQKVLCKNAAATKVSNRKKMAYVMGANRVIVSNVPSSFPDYLFSIKPFFTTI